MDLLTPVWDFLTKADIVRALSGSDVAPQWLTTTASTLLLLGALVGAVRSIARGTELLVGGWLRAFSQSADDRARLDRLQLFAKHRAARLETEFRPDRFVDLEADFYRRSTGGSTGWRWPFRPLSRGAQRRKALTRAIIDSGDEFAQLEGDPGAGKSVVLQEVAHRLCVTAAKSRDPRRPIGLYLNLKMLERRPDRRIDEALIREFVLEDLNRGRDATKRETFERDFDWGLANGKWLFLFDSFDEIPEVLSSEDESTTIREYFKAIHGFATGPDTRSRSLLATRHFRRPQESRLAQYRVLALNDRQRNTLVGRANLRTDAAERLYNAMAAADSGTQYIVESPMYLGLLIEYAISGGSAAPTPHELFKNYVDSLFVKKGDELREYRTEPASLQHFAETIAFAILNDTALGLNPRRTDLLESVKLNDEAGARLLDALIALKLARGNEDDGPHEPRRFTFTHRRFQEYFATCFVLRTPDSVSESALLFDPRWRESAAVLLTSAPGAKLDALVALLGSSLAEAGQALRDADKLCDDVTDQTVPPAPDFFPWPPHALHLLGLLKDGFADDATRMPAALMASATDILRSGFLLGLAADKRVALELAPVVDPALLISMIRRAVAFGSELLDDAAFRLVRRLPDVPDDLSRWIRHQLVHRAYRGELSAQRRTLLAFMWRVKDHGGLFNVTRLLSHLALVDVTLHGVLLILGLTTASSPGAQTAVVMLVGWNLLARRWFWRSLSEQPRVRQNVSKREVGAETFLVVFPAVVLVGMRCLLLWTLAGSVDQWRLWASLWLSAWAGAAAMAAASGQFTRMRWWPLLPIHPLLMLAANPVPISTGFLQHLKTSGWVYLVMAAGGWLTWITINAIPAPGPGSVLIGIAIVVAIVGVLPVTRWAIDLISLRRANAAQGVLAGPDFVRELTAYRTDDARLRYLRHVTEGLPLSHDATTLRLVRVMARALERGLHAIQAWQADEATPKVAWPWQHRANAARFLAATSSGSETESPAFHAWIQRCGRGLAASGPPLLDELLRLEQRIVEAQRPEARRQPTPASRPGTPAAMPASGAVQGRDSTSATRLTCFVSYTRADKTWAEWIAWTLDKAGFDVRFQEWDFRPGQNFVVAMHTALQEADTVVAVLSPAYLESRFAEAEWMDAFARDPTGRSGALLPVRVQACEPGPFLAQRIHVDLVGRSAEEAEALLVAAFLPRNMPTTAPAFPGTSGHHAAPAAAPAFPGASEQR